jgi:GTP-binding protein
MIVAIVGRPNVGKSTLFNRLTESKQAIVDETAGVTRDRIYGKSEWIGKTFSVIDTGGYVRNSDDIFEEEIRKQVDIAIEEANLILFVVDVENGVTDHDESVAQILRRSKKDVILVTNKVDNNARIIESNVFYKFGLGDPMCISSINGSGTGELLDKIVSYIKEEVSENELDIPKYTVLGRPNVGKSSLINALIGEERNIVTPISGTTRDSINTRYNKFDQDFYLVDTAGIRKKAKVKEDLEFYSVLRSIRALEEADVCLLMIDAENGIEAQDLSIISLIQKNNKGMVILVNKWDLIEKETNTAKEYTEKIKSRIAPFTDVPIIFTSVLTKQRIHKVLEEAKRVYENRRRKITTSKLNELMQGAIAHYGPPAIKGKLVKIKYVTQLNTYYPSFAFFCNLPQYVKDSYKRYLENKLRENFDFSGSPITIYMRKK